MTAETTVKLPPELESLFDSSGNLKKATPVLPPEALKLDTDGMVDIDMTNYYRGMWAMAITSVALTAGVSYLWRKVKRQDEYLEAIREYISRSVNETQCGKLAYVSLLEDMGDKDDVDYPVNWAHDLEDQHSR